MFVPAARNREPRREPLLSITSLAVASVQEFGAGVDPAVAVRQPIDASVRLVTPERVVFDYPVAGPARRALAFTIDAVMLIVLLIVSVFLIRLLFLGHQASLGVIFALMFAVVWGYGAGCEGCCNGRTLGKRLVGLRVISAQGVPITGSQAVIRNLIGVVDGPVAFLFLPGLICMALTRRFQRLGDLAAGTMVIIEEEKREAKIVRVAERAVADLLPFLPLRVAANRATARALSDYVQHRSRFVPARREEIARHLAVLLRERYNLPTAAGGDAILCAYYHRIFLGD